ncbi:hypothetical protein BASA82_001117 [Batrachochytrium salamandrivorans]|nr:hypothetical protein BASA82_001117 [Batrachochytrium salamandrivorans]
MFLASSTTSWDCIRSGSNARLNSTPPSSSQLLGSLTNTASPRNLPGWHSCTVRVLKSSLTSPVQGISACTGPNLVDNPNAREACEGNLLARMSTKYTNLGCLVSTAALTTGISQHPLYSNSYLASSLVVAYPAVGRDFGLALGNVKPY